MTEPQAFSRAHTLARLRQWSPLSPAEVPLVTNTISEKESQLKEVQSRIHILEQELQMLKSQSEELCEDLFAHRALKSPIRSLPIELLSEILSLSCTESELGYKEKNRPLFLDEYSELFTEETFAVTTIKIPAIILSHVCSTWNSVLNYSSFMWSRLSLAFGLIEPIDFDHLRVMAHRLKRLETALEYVLSRSGHVPLHVSLKYFDDGEGMIRPEIASVLSCFLAQSHRWKTVDLAIQDAENPPFTQLSTLIPTLETLSLHLERSGPEESEMQAHMTVAHIFGQTPSLRAVTFCSSYAFLQSQLVWSDLHTLIFDTKMSPSNRNMPAIPISFVQDVLTQCKSLRTLSWNAPIDVKRRRADDGPVILPVTELVGGLFVHHLLPFITLPNIKTFDLTATAPNNQSSKTSILSHLKESYREKVTALNITDPPSYRRQHSIPAIFSVLAGFPGLQALTLNYSQKMTSAAYDYEEIPPSLPNLKALKWTLQTTNAAFDTVFKDAVALLKAFQRSARGPDGLSVCKASVLEKVELHIDRSRLTNEQHSMLRDVRESGLDITLHTGSIDI